MCQWYFWQFYHWREGSSIVALDGYVRFRSNNGTFKLAGDFTNISWDGADVLLSFTLDLFGNTG